MNRFILSLTLLASLLFPSAEGDAAKVFGPMVKAPAFVYTGPGDVITTGWLYFHGSRAFTAATRGNKLWNVCNSTGGTDVACADVLSDASTGNAVPQTIGGLSCPAANCTIKTYYDISGQTNCTGPCDDTQIAIAGRVTWTANAIGTKSCGVSAGSIHYNSAALSGSTAQPYTDVAIAQFSSVAANELFWGTSGGGGVGAGVVPTSFAAYSSTVFNGSTANTSPISMQSIFNGGSSQVIVNGNASSAQAGGSAAMSGNINLFSDSFTQYMVGTLCENGVMTGTINSTQWAALYANARAWGSF